MPLSAIIEIPKGCDRRIHKAWDGSGFIDLGPTKEQVPVNDGKMPVHYGFIEHTLNNTEKDVVHKDEVDVIVFSNKEYKTGDVCTIKIIGMLTREDGDHKVVAVDDSRDLKSFDDLGAEEKKLVLDFMGYKSKIVSIDTKEVAEAYVQDSRI